MVLARTLLGLVALSVDTATWDGHTACTAAHRVAAGGVACCYGVGALRTAAVLAAAATGWPLPMGAGLLQTSGLGALQPQGHRKALPYNRSHLSWLHGHVATA